MKWKTLLSALENILENESPREFSGERMRKARRKLNAQNYQSLFRLRLTPGEPHTSLLVSLLPQEDASAQTRCVVYCCKTLVAVQSKYASLPKYTLLGGCPVVRAQLGCCVTCAKKNADVLTSALVQVARLALPAGVRTTGRPFVPFALVVSTKDLFAWSEVVFMFLTEQVNEEDKPANRRGQIDRANRNRKSRTSTGGWKSHI